MARILFIDENDRRGEIPLDRVKPGDVCRFQSDFTKHADGEEDDTEKRVMAGELAEVLDVFPMMPGLLVEVSAVVHSMGSSITGTAQILVTPNDVALIVDARDPRLSSHRIDAQMALRDVETALESVPRIFRAHRAISVGHLTRRGYREAARLIARVEDTTWTDYAQASGHTRSAAQMGDWLPLALWALTQFERDYPGASKLSLKSRRHVMWALDQLATDIENTIPAHELDWRDEDAENAQLVQETRELRSLLDRSSDEDWVRTLPTLADAMDDPELDREYRRWLGQPTELEAPPPPPGRGEPASPPDPGTDTPPPVDPALTPPDDEEDTTPEAPAIPSEPVEDVQALPDDPSALQLAGPRSPPGPPPAPERTITLDVDPAEIILEEPADEPEPEPGDLDVDDVDPDADTLDLPVRALPSSSTQYDVRVFGEEDEHPAHGWATPKPQIRVPIMDAREPGGSATSKVWAEPEMLVRHRDTGQTAPIATLEGGLLGVDVGGEIEFWPARAVEVSPAWPFPTRPAAPAELARWRKHRAPPSPSTAPTPPG